jgi:hypothetical protein
MSAQVYLTELGEMLLGASAVGGEFRQQIFLTRSRKEREGKRFLWVSAPSLEEDSSATEFRPLRVLCGFA